MNNLKPKPPIIVAQIGFIASIICALIAGAVLLLATKHHRIKSDIAAPYLARAQHDDDIAWLLLRDSARRHLAAVRSGSKDRPDNQLGHDIAVYAGASKAFFRKDHIDPMPRLAALRQAMDGLRPLDAKRIECSSNDLASSRVKQCTAYFDAIADLFGRDF